MKRWRRRSRRGCRRGCRRCAPSRGGRTSSTSSPQGRICSPLWSWFSMLRALMWHYAEASRAPACARPHHFDLRTKLELCATEKTEDAMRGRWRRRTSFKWWKPCSTSFPRRRTSSLLQSKSSANHPPVSSILHVRNHSVPTVISAKIGRHFRFPACVHLSTYLTCDTVYT